MHKFIKYISDLLFLHDCVIIPDFGGFICNYRSAYIDENNGQICPPTKDILFNRNLIHNDGLLINWISTKENISYEKATIQLSLFCEDLKIKLNQQQRIIFGDIGIFYTDRRYNILFEPKKNNFFAEAFGMEPLNIHPVKEIKAKPVQISMSSPMTSEKPSYLNIDSSGNILHRLLKYALATTAIAGIIVVSQLHVFQTNDWDHSGKITNNSTIQPELSTTQIDRSGRIICNNVISPEYDYVDYDPLNDWKKK